MISTSPVPDSELRLDQDDDPHMAHDWIFNPEAIQCCPNNNPLIDFAGYKWWTNFHWSKESGPYVWGGKNPNEPVTLSRILDHSQVEFPTVRSSRFSVGFLFLSSLANAAGGKFANELCGRWTL
jgi:hypothetical protein